MFGKKYAAPICPLMKSECMRERCMFWVHLLGQNPQTDQPIDAWDCSIRFLPVLLIEGAQQSRQAGAAVESLRNEFVSGQSRLNSAMQRLVNLAEEARRLAAAPHGERDVTPKPLENES